MMISIPISKQKMFDFAKNDTQNILCVAVSTLHIVTHEKHKINNKLYFKGIRC